MAALTAALPLTAPTWADNYPNRPITIIVPFPPGDGTDLVARLIGAEIGAQLGQAVVIENKPGATGQLGLAMTAKASPNGYTLGVAQVANMALAPSTYRNLPYHPLKDFVPVAMLSTNYLAVVTRPDAPFKTVSEMTQWAKAHPDTLTLGTTGTAGLQHLSFALLAKESNGFTFTNVPYKGNGAVMTDLVGGRIDVAFPSYTAAAPLIASGQIRLLGITNPGRDARLKDLPTVGESVPGYGAVGWYGIVAPAGTPPAIVKRLNAEINRATRQPRIQDALHAMGLQPVTESPEYFGQLIDAESQKFAALVKDIGYEPQ
ncbi:hypothetical protein BAU07_03350 [Bordetella flabilis]|uniref:ABC transporter substrate-binding protein n=2 Tax=Bordetella flabilis TaxID=463014 RepID=A0A193GJE0_9BORD|nr:hypothetical protein BAU07_03350 [Bordetella flabilis]